MKRSDIESNGEKRKATEPPPFRNVTPEPGQIELDPPNDGFFSNGLIRFLMVELLLVAILLAANIFVVLGAKTVQTTKATPGNAGANTGAAVVNQEDQSDVEASPEFIANESESNFNNFRKSASQTDGKMQVVRFAKLEKIPAETASEIQHGENTDRLSKAINIADANRTKGNRANKEAETNLFSNLATLRERVNAQHQKAFGNPRPSSEVCELGTCTDPRQTHVPIGAPYYGTKIKWNRVVKDAVTQAKSEDKLVFLIHVSGNFTKEEFT